MKLTLEELEAATKAVLDPAYAQAKTITDAAQEKVDKILEDGGWTRWEWCMFTEPGCMGAGPYIREAEKNASKLRKLLKGLHIIYKYDPNTSMAVDHDGIFVGSKEVFDRMSKNDKYNLETLHGFIYQDMLESWLFLT